MRLGMIGLGRMGAAMIRRLIEGGHECVVYDRSRDAIEGAVAYGATGAGTIKEFVKALPAPRVIWIMVPASAVDHVLAELKPLLKAGDTVIDGGNSNYRDDLRRAGELQAAKIHYVDVGTSGGLLGYERGFCLMVGGEEEPVAALEPVFATLALGAAPTLAPGTNRRKSNANRGRQGPAADPGGTAGLGYLHCGPCGAGHFVKMVHNGIEYGLMAAYAEGFNVLARADAGLEGRAADAETAPLSDPQFFRYQFDIAAIAELWRHGSIITSQLLDITANALARDPKLDTFAGRVSDSGEGRWTLQAAIEEGVPAYVLSAALFSRFTSRGHAEFADKLLSAMRLGFGGHAEPPRQ
jgi:6-phosphogluconate dehydrogenase